jgi:hypothetical protein
MSNWIHPYWIIAAIALGLPTIWFYAEVAAPIIYFLKTGGVQ